jgi:hypothetical protein
MERARKLREQQPSPNPAFLIGGSMAARILSRNSTVVSFEELRKAITLPDWIDRNARWRQRKEFAFTNQDPAKCDHKTSKLPDPSKNVEYCPQCKTWIIHGEAKVVDLPPAEILRGCRKQGGAQ